MGCPSEVEIGDNLIFSVVTHDPGNNQITDADVDPAYRLYEDETATPILTGTLSKLDDANTLGFYSETVAATVGNGFENGKTYTIYITATVGGDTGGVSYGFKAYDSRKSNVQAISDDTVAAQNLELMYDGTGYTDDTAPASRSQLDQLSVTGAAVNVGTIDAPGGFVLTTGSQVNDSDSTRALDGVRHELTDAAGSLDVIYKFNIGGDGVPTSVTFTGVFNGGNDDFIIEANSGTDATPVWEQIGTLLGSNSGANVTNTYPMLAGQIVSDIAGEVQIRVRELAALSGASFDVDQVFVSKSVVNRSVGYALGAIWVNTNITNINTEPYVDGTADNPVSTWAAAETLSASLGIKKFELISGTAIALAGDSSSYEIEGYGADVDLNGQVIDGATFRGCHIDGVGTGSVNMAHFHECELNNATIPPSHVQGTGINNTLTLGSAGDYFLVDCYSQVAGASSPIIDLGAAVGASNISLRRFGGGCRFDNILTGDTISAEATVGGTLTLNGTGGIVEARGGWKQVNSAGFSGTLTDVSVNTRFDNTQGATFDTATDSLEAIRNNQGGGSITAQEVRDAMKLAPTGGAPAAGSVDEHLDIIEADTNEIQTDLADGGRLDLLIDAILADTSTDGVVLSTATQQAIADTLLNRDMSLGTDSGTTTIRTVRQALRFLRNRWDVSGTTLTVYKEDDNTSSWTAQVATDPAADPVTGSNPAGGA